ncbi:MAG: HDIG domain-containing protein [Proteobacteria bacterium]|nr:HDIG domain-containing protein [Pseudomonadota bacterium]MBU1582675.1 HDIG domain-containing protein [Pseudomonadota bacterium]MBU2453346.1 HDIG domain-containing protein [Pseudomonadota bacterium]MBU2629657.1 HDIG domain-containing protein [Pseudomonadota bacterium]
MTTAVPTRADAFTLLKKYNKKDGLIRHALAVEAVMGHFAQRFNEDKEKWQVIGLVHDLDYEMFPEAHCHKCVELFRAHDWPEEYIRAVISHGWGICTDVKPETNLEKTLYAIDELTGLVASAALVRPSKSILDIKAKSVKKKFKDKSFAAGVDRQVIIQGAGFLDMELSDLITEVISGMRPVAEEIGLKGNL